MSPGEKILYENFWANEHHYLRSRHNFLTSRYNYKSFFQTIMICRLLKCYINLSDNDVDLSDNDINLSYLYVDLSDNFVAICMAKTGKEPVFSSPELKAQVSFSDHLSSVVCPSVRLSVNFSYFRLLLQNHWANFNQTWHKASMGGGDSSFYK